MLLLLIGVHAVRFAWEENRDNGEAAFQFICLFYFCSGALGELNYFETEEEKSDEFTQLFGEITELEEMSGENLLSKTKNEMKDIIGKEKDETSWGNYPPKRSENRSSEQLIGGINKMLDDIKAEHTQNNKLLQSNFRKSDDLQNNIKNLTRTKIPVVLSEQMKYLVYSEDLVITKQDDEVSVYVNITKDGDNHLEVDKDGHMVHIHIPHRVLEEMAETGDDHVIHINVPQKDASRHKVGEVTKKISEKKIGPNQDHQTT